MNSLIVEDVLNVLPEGCYVVSLKTRKIIHPGKGALEMDTAIYRVLFEKDKPFLRPEIYSACRQLGQGNDMVEFYAGKKEDEVGKGLKVQAKLMKDNFVFISIAGNVLQSEMDNDQAQSTKQLRRAEKLAGFGYWELNIDTQSIYASVGSNAIYGNVRNVLSVDEVSCYTHEEDRPYFLKNIRALMNDGSPVDMKYRIKRPSDGEVRWIHAIANLKPDNKIAYGIVLDVTDFVTAEQIMRDQEGYMKLLFENMNSSFAQYKLIVTEKGDPVDYVYIDVNSKFEEFSGFKKENIVNKPVSQIEPGISKARIKKYGQVALTGVPIEFVDYSEDTDKYYEVSVFSPQRGYFAVISTDVTQKKKAEKALEIAKEQAVESDRLKTLFLANMSHEIRTPLNGILGFSSLLMDDHVDKENRKNYRKIIENSGHRLMTVIDDIINISMIQSNQLKIEISKFDLHDLLQEIFVVYRHHYKDRLSTIDFRLKLYDENSSLVIRSDKDRIYQVFKNLLDNAFKFTREGFVEFGTRYKNKGELVLFVKDSGIGIRKSKQAIIFNSFRQAEEGQGRKYEGSGLGLAIVAGIAEKLDGRVRVESEPGRGAEFMLTIPHVKPGFPESKLQLGMIDPYVKTEHARTIVSFEDDRLSAEFLKTVVESLGYNLVNFDRAEDGIEYIQKNRTDMIFMDVQLPEMSGYEATKIIKSRNPKIPIVIQTAFAMPEDKEKAYGAGCDDYITKPMTIDSLRNKLDKYLSAKG